MVNWNRAIVPNSMEADTFALYEPIIGEIFLESICFLLGWYLDIRGTMKNIFFFLGVGNLDRVLLSLVIIILIDWSIFFFFFHRRENWLIRSWSGIWRGEGIYFTKIERFSFFLCVCMQRKKIYIFFLIDWQMFKY